MNVFDVGDGSWFQVLELQTFSSYSH